MENKAIIPGEILNFTGKIRDAEGKETGNLATYYIKYYGSIELDVVHGGRDELVRIKDAIDELIWQANNLFVPPLSYRIGASGSTSVQQIGNLKQKALDDYCNNMLGQKNIVAFHKDTIDGKQIEKIVGFMSFKHDYGDRGFLPKEILNEDIVNYVTTIIVNERHQRRGITKKLYEYVENYLPSAVHARCVATRTWDTNKEHLGFLDHYGYRLACTLHDQREFDGDTFDTVFYSKRVSREQENARVVHGM